MDDRHYPILIVTWIGEATVPLVRTYQQWQTAQAERARASGIKLVSLTDGSRATRPGANVRKAFADGEIPGHDIMIKSVVVVTNPLIRGAITAVRWLMGESFGDVELVESNAIAIERCLETLDQHGIARPSRLSPTTYEPPAARTRAPATA